MKKLIPKTVNGRILNQIEISILYIMQVIRAKNFCQYSGREQNGLNKFMLFFIFILFKSNVTEIIEYNFAIHTLNQFILNSFVL